MASNVFGNPITDETLKELSEYENKIITRIDRAAVAFQWKDTQRREPRINVHCMFYNATGDPLKFVTAHNYYGHVHSPYPTVIENGLWGVFVHGEDSSNPIGTSAAVVYRGVNKDDKSCDWMVAWSIQGNNYKVYTEIREAGHYDGGKYWDYIKGLIQSKGGLSDQDQWSGCLSSVKINEAIFPTLQGIMTLAA